MGEKRSLASFAETDFGGHLRAARQARGITVRDIAQRTKIPVSTLEALERNDTSRLPGGIFSRSFVRAYAHEAGLDPDETLREFQRCFPDQAPVSERPTAESIDDGSADRQFGLAAGVLTVCGALLVAGAAVYAWRGGFTPKSQAEAGPGMAPVAMGLSGSSGPETASPSAARPIDKGPSIEAGAPLQRRPGAADTVVPTTGRVPPSVGRDPGPIRIAFEPSRTCWVRVTLDDDTRWARLMKAGERVEHQASESVYLEVGDAGALAYTLNGRPGRPLGESGAVVRRRIDRANLGEFQR
jgi:cytoskeletal protein RodZ